MRLWLVFLLFTGLLVGTLAQDADENGDAEHTTVKDDHEHPEHDPTHEGHVEGDEHDHDNDDDATTPGM